jgi:hypothetical protein
MKLWSISSLRSFKRYRSIRMKVSALRIIGANLFLSFENWSRRLARRFMERIATAFDLSLHPYFKVLTIASAILLSLALL